MGKLFYDTNGMIEFRLSGTPRGILPCMFESIKEYLTENGYYFKDIADDSNGSVAVGRGFNPTLSISKHYSMQKRRENIKEENKKKEMINGGIKNEL